MLFCSRAALAASMKDSEPDVPIAWAPEAHRALSQSYLDWIHEVTLFRRLADSSVPISS